MIATLLNFSQRPELEAHAAIIADVRSAAARLNAEVMIVGAFARDLHLVYGLGINTGRATEDVDLALAISDWPAFGKIKEDLIGQAGSRRRASSHTAYGTARVHPSISCHSAVLKGFTGKLPGRPMARS